MLLRFLNRCREVENLTQGHAAAEHKTWEPWELSPVFSAFSGRFVVNLSGPCLCPPEKRNQCFLHSYFRDNNVRSFLLPYPTDPTCNKRGMIAIVIIMPLLRCLAPSQSWGTPSPVILILSFSCIYQQSVKSSKGGTPVVQWLRIRLAMQGTWVWSLVGELRSHVP